MDVRRHQSTITGLAYALTIGMALTLAAIVVVVIRQFPGNHTAFNVRLVALLPIAAALVLGAGLVARAPRMPLRMLLIASVAFVAFVGAADRWNVLVPYEVWIKRGAPASPLVSR